jgi:hypothetical protein
MVSQFVKIMSKTMLPTAQQLSLAPVLLVVVKWTKFVAVAPIQVLSVVNSQFITPRVVVAVVDLLLPQPLARKHTNVMTSVHLTHNVRRVIRDYAV